VQAPLEPEGCGAVVVAEAADRSLLFRIAVSKSLLPNAFRD